MKEEQKNFPKKYLSLIIENKSNSKIEPKSIFKIKIDEDHYLKVLLIVLKTKLHLNSEQAIFLFYRKKILKPSLKIKDLFMMKKKNDKIMKIEYSEIDSFGK